MTEEFANGYPDSEPLSKIFESYKNSVSKERLLAPQSLNRLFSDAAYKARLLRRVRMQWGVAIAGLAVVMVGSFLLLIHPKPIPLPLPAPVVQAIKPLDITRGQLQGDSEQGLQQSDFRLSKYNYDSRLNLDSVVRNDPNLGPEWSEADFTDLKEYSTTSERVDTLIQWLHLPLLVNHGVPEAYDTVKTDLPDSLTGFYVLWRGKKYVSPDTQGWHYYIARWDHHRPKWWQKYAQIDHEHLVLGAWSDLHLKVLAVRRKAKQHKKLNS